MPIFRRKTTCYCMWSVFAGSTGCGRLRYCGAMLRVLHLVGFLSSRFTHDARSQEHKAYNLMFVGPCIIVKTEE